LPADFTLPGDEQLRLTLPVRQSQAFVLIHKENGMKRIIGIRLLIAAVLFLTCGLATAQPQSGQNGYADGQDDGRPKARYLVVPPQPAKKHSKAGPGASLTTWQGGFVYNNTQYNYTMVGTNPFTTNVGTGIQAFVVPLKLVYIQTDTIFDPTVDKFAGTNQSVLTTVLQSPVLSAANTISFPEGATQYADAFQRANFWSSVGSTNTNYHVTLWPVTLPEMAIPVGPGEGSVEVNPWNGITTGLVNQATVDLFVQAYINGNQNIITPNSLPIFLLDNAYMTSGGCCIGGYHSSNGGSISGQTYIVASAVDPVLDASDSAPFSQDVSALSHEVGEWMDDPFVNNPVPQVGSCRNTILEVGDPIEDNPDFGDYAYSLNGFTYHLQDLALVPYFGAGMTTFGNRYTFQGENLTTCNNTFAGSLAANMDTYDKKLQLYNLGKDSNNFDDSRLLVDQFSFNGANWSFTDVGANAGVPPATLGAPIISYDNTIYGATEAFYLGTDPQGNQDVEQLWGAGWSPTNLTDNGNAQPAAMGSRMSGFIDPKADTDNVFYQGTDQHVHVLTWSPGKAWGEDTTIAGKSVAAWGSALSGHVTANSQEIFYITPSQHIYELWRWSPTSDGWHSTDVTAVSGSVNAAPSSPLAGFYDSRAGVDAVFYIGTDGDVHEILLSGGRWSSIDMTAKTGARKPIAGSQLAAHLNTIANSEEVFYVDSNQVVEEFWTGSYVVPDWNISNLGAHQLSLADPGSPLATSVDTAANPARDEIYFIGTNAQVLEMYWTPAGGWVGATP
jgi:hypothetical protein